MPFCDEPAQRRLLARQRVRSPRSPARAAAGPPRAAPRSSRPTAACEPRTPSRRRPRPTASGGAARSRRCAPTRARVGGPSWPSSAPLASAACACANGIACGSAPSASNSSCSIGERRRAHAQARHVRRRADRARRRRELRDGRAARARPARRPALEARRSTCRSGSLAASASSARSSGAIHGSANTPSAGTCSDHCSAEPTARSAAPSFNAANSRAASRPESDAPGYSFAASRASPVSASKLRPALGRLAERQRGTDCDRDLELATASPRRARTPARRRRCRRAADAHRATRVASKRSRARSSRTDARCCMPPMLAPRCAQSAIARPRMPVARRGGRARHAADPGRAARSRTSAHPPRSVRCSAASTRRIARDDVGARMSEAIAIADGEDRVTRRDGGDERRRRRRAAAVVRHDSTSAASDSRRVVDQRDLAHRLDVAGEERAARRRDDAQHAGQVVGLAPRVGVVLARPGTAARSARRPTPSCCPSRQRSAGPRSACARDDRAVVRQRRHEQRRPAPPAAPTARRRCGRGPCG